MKLEQAGAKSERIIPDPESTGSTSRSDSGLNRVAASSNEQVLAVKRRDQADGSVEETRFSAVKSGRVRKRDV